MLDPTSIRRRFYKKLNIAGMDSVRENRHSPADSGFGADTIPSPVSECSEVSSDTMTRATSTDSVLENTSRTSHDGQASPSLVKVQSVPKVSFQRNYRVKYLGGICLDRRYTQPMLPWVVADLRREGLRQPTDVLLEVRDSSLRARLYSEEKVLFEHSLNTISKFAKTSVDHTCFTYLQKDSSDLPPQCHVFQAGDEETVLELFMTVREVSKELASHKQGGMSPLCRVGSGTGLEAFLSNAQQFEVLYVGKIKGSSKHNSHTFLDEAVDRFKAKQQQEQQKQQLGDSIKGKTVKINSIEASPGVNGISAQVTKGVDVGVCRSSSGNISSPSSEFSSLENISEVSGADESPHHDKNVDNREDSIPVALVTHSQSLDPTSSEALLENLKGTCGNKCGIVRDSLVPPSPHTLITHTHSLDSQSKQSVFQDLQNAQLTAQRVRSISGDIPRPAKQTSLPIYRTRVGSGGSVDLRRPLVETGRRNNRTMLFLILKKELCLLSTDRKQVLVNKPFSDISRCSLGVKHPDHFGFNCRDASLTSTDNYVFYIFKCSTVEVANEIMQTMKQAFHSAHQTGQPTREPPSGFLQSLCDSCPMQKFHKLCLELEGLSPEACRKVIGRRIYNLSEADKQNIQAKYQGAQVQTVQEGNEVYMTLLRQLYERKQLKHTHQPQGQRQEGLLEIKAPSFTFDNLKEKAKKSLTNSFDTILKRKGKEVEGRGRSATLPTEDMFKLTMNDSSPTSGSLVSSREGSCDPSAAFGSYSPCKEQSPSPLMQRPRSSTISSTRDARARDSASRAAKDDATTNNDSSKQSPIMKIFMKVGSSRHHSSSDEDSCEAPSQNMSWRQTIFHRVQTPTKGPDTSNDDTSTVWVPESPAATPEKQSKSRITRTREELRNLWKTAIRQQILLIRMEKENRKLQEHQDEATNKRIRLDYEDVTPCLKDTAQLWDELLKEPADTRINPDVLQDLVRAGVPRHRRGEIWHLLANQYKLRSQPASVASFDTSVQFRHLLNELTIHQHAILIDLGRTFPNHPFYKDCLGAGQMSLYNLLKAYSLLDKEVGYCQGLSFVSGVLLLHMSEEEAFEMMKHFLFYLGFRKQYKPDMIALQVQLYQLYRLVHDHYPDLYKHFEKHDISPALFAAPWFLTLFASQFPLGFVSRLFDLIFLQGMEAVFKVGMAVLGTFADTLMSCSSFEAIMDCFKNKLPSPNAIQMERLFAQVFSLDISRELLAYEVEYHLIQEEMLYTPRKETVSSEELETNRSLRRQNMELLEQLQVANNNVTKLEASVTSYQGTVKHLEARIRDLEDERDALLHSNNCLRHRVERLEHRDDASAPESETSSRAPSLGATRSLSFGAGETADGIASMVRQLYDTAEHDEGDSASNNSDERIDGDEQTSGGL
ncbi:TBC1 domain family member 4-like isoform X1 [Ornithodoros turicata]|uniref:TBC1 domain family member 4-like isoform X1 n=1 Tax=Ornithodoros turicata TaxID=34597 RepID=UPI0031393A6C